MPYDAIFQNRRTCHRLIGAIWDKDQADLMVVLLKQNMNKNRCIYADVNKFFLK